ncbi:MAG TPA: hypothetical protein VMU33_09570 [Burkholderiaceae bacterium]|nr:hypothetical protein [Burkholderiaceae bacterium]
MATNTLPPPMPRRQRGVALIYGLIAIVILMVAAAAMLRTMDTATGLAGSAGFHRDLVNASDQGVITAHDQFTANNLTGAAARIANLQKANYSAVSLPNDPNGIPLALIDDNVFAALGLTTNDLTDANGNKIRYVIDRLCTQAGAPTATTCVPYVQQGDKSGSTRIQRAGQVNQWVYRISVRVTDPKNSMTFIQTMLGA